MGFLGFMMALNVAYYQFSISAATILFFCAVYLLLGFGFAGRYARAA